MNTILSNFIGKSKRGFLQTLVLLVLVSVGILSQPALAQTTPQAPCTLADIDRDNDGLIEICDLEGLNAIRYQLDGSGYKASRSATKITAGCAGGGCKGYELNKDLDFDSDASYSNVANKARWTTGLGWQPIGRTWNSFRGTFEGNGYTISNLTVNRLTFNDIGLFGHMRADAEIINVGLLDVDIQGFENVGGLVGYSHGSSVKNSYVMGSVIGDEDVGGLVGENRDSSIKNSYVMGSVEGRVWVGGLTGWNVRGDITNSYAAGAVKGNSAVGGLIGSNIGDNVRNSYWDKTTSRMSSGSGGVGKTTTELQSPTTATGIYSSWSTNNWDFGTREQYPVLKYRDGTLMPNQRRDRLEELSQLDILNPTSCSTADRDQDNDGLIEICNLEGLDAIRYQLDGSGYRASESATKITAGCAESGCKGYELIADLDFDDDASYSNVANKVTWTTGSGWQPIGTSSNPFNAIFRANKYSISKLMIARSSLNQVGLFGNMGSQARIEGVGLIDADVRGDEGVGGLVGYNSGGTIINSYVTGIVRGDDSVGGLVGDNYGPITNSYTNVEMSGDSWVGGIVGCNFSGGIVTNSYTVPRINRSSSSSGGLLGANGGSRSINSYWDKEVSGISSGDYGVGLTTAELQSPITSTGIYSRWSTNAWDFGSNEQYPALKYRDGTLMPNQGREIPEELPQIEIVGVPAGAVDEGERITLTASSTSNANNIPLIYQWRQTSGRTLLTSPTSGSSVILDVPEDYVMARATTSNLVLTLGVSSDVGSNTQQISITIAKRNNGGIAALGVPSLNERELTVPSIDLSGDPDGIGNNIRYQWQSKQSAQTGWVNVQTAGTNEGYTIPADTAGVVEYRVVVSYTDGQGYRERVASEASIYEGNTIPSVEIAGVSVSAVNEGERITLTAFPHNSENNILPSYSWTQTSGKTLLTSPTSGSRVTLDVPEDYVAASENTGNAVLILEASNDVGSTTQQVLITIAKRNNGGIAALGIPSLNERELVAPSIDLSGDPDGSGNNIRYQWQSRQSTQTAWIDVSVAGTNARYTIPADTEGIVQYRVVVHYTDGQGYGEEVVSATVIYERINIASLTSCGIADIDQDDDGLIEICDLEGLDAMRYQMDGSGYRASLSATKITAGCAEDGCKGYELNKDLDFDNDASYRDVANKATWTTGSGWQPLRHTDGDYQSTTSTVFNAVFEGNNYTLSNLMINRSANAVGLFGKIGNQARLNSVGLIDVDVRGNWGVGGLAGHNSGGAITNSYVIGLVRGNNSIGGLVGDNYGPITNSYTNVEMLGNNYVGGIVGCNFYEGIITNSYTVSLINRSFSNSGGLLGYDSSGSLPINSYWDKDVSGISSGDYGVGLTTEELRSPTTSTGIYSRWSIRDWDFGTREQYPALKYRDGTLMPNQRLNIVNITSCGIADVDQDNDGLIEICDLEGLSAMRYQKDGSGYRTNGFATKITTGCAEGGCKGYELARDLDFSEDASYRDIVNKATWTTGEGWEPIGSFGSVFDGNGYTISHLMINRSTSEVGLFGSTVRGAEIVNAGLLSVDVQGNDYVGGLVGANRHGSSIANSYAIGSVQGIRGTGVLVGYSYFASITSSYAMGSVEGRTYVGSLVGDSSYSNVTNSYATGSVKGDDYTGGLVGDNWYSDITNSYAIGSVVGIRGVGGLTGRNTQSITNSYWDKTTSGMSGNDGGAGKTTTQLQSPTGATGIYSSWSTNDWDFGTREQYPALKYSDGTLMPNQGREMPEEPAQIPQIEIAGVPTGAVDEGERITLTASSTNNANNIPLIYQWRQTSGKTLLTNPTSGNSVTLNVPEDYVAARANIRNLRLTLRVSNEVGSTAHQVSITIAKRNNGGIAVLGVPSLNERELTAPSINLGGDPDGGGSNVGYQWQSRQSTQTAWIDVSAGTNERYTIPADTTGVVQYRVVMSYTDGQGYGEEVLSGAVIYERRVAPQPSIDIASLTSCGTADIDQDDDGLIEICDLEGLNAIRYQVDGSGYRASVSATKITAGCAEGGCKGYELNKKLDFDDDASYRNIANKAIWTTGAGWNPIGHMVYDGYLPITTSTSFNAIFEGNNHTISNLMIARSTNEVGLFGRIGSQARLNSVGLINVDVRGNWGVGGLAGYNTEGTITNSYVIGSVRGDASIGGLVGDNYGPITNSYTNVEMSGNNYVGGIAGCNFSGGIVTNSYTVPRISSSFPSSGGLLGYDSSGSLPVNSYWDKDVSGISSGYYGIGLTTEALQSPTTATGIYSRWSVRDWDFGTREQYPALKHRDGTLMPNQRRGRPEEPVQIPQIEIAGVPTGAVDEGERIILTASSTSSASDIPLIHQWQQTSGEALLIEHIILNSVAINVPKDYVTARANTDNVVLMLGISNNVGNTTQQVSITIAKRNNGGIAVLGVPSLNERELTAPSIDLSGDPDGGGNNIRYQWQSKQGAQTVWVNVPAFGTNEQYTIPADTAGVVQYRVVVRYTDGQGYEEQIESEALTYEGNTIPNVEIVGVPTGAVGEGERITLTALSQSSTDNIPLSYSWTQTLGKTLLISPIRGSSVTLDVPEDYVVASDNTGNVVLTLEVSNDVGSTIYQVSITIAKRNNGGIAALGVPGLNERELTAPSIDLSGDPDGIGSNIRYQWQSKQGAQTEWVNVPVAGTNALYIIPANTAGVVQYRVAVSYTDGQGYEEQVESGTSSYKGNTIPSVEIAGVPVSAVNEGEQITLTASPHNSDNNILPSYSWTQTSGKTLLIGPTRGSSVTLDVPEDYVVASENTGNVMLILEASNDVGSTAQQVLITIAKRNNGGITVLGVPSLNERELTAPSIDISGDPDGVGSNIRYQWQSRQSAQTAWLNVQTAGTNALYTIPANTAGVVQYRVAVSYTDGQGYEEQVESEASTYEGNTIPNVEITGVPASAVNEGEQITLTAFPHNSENNILPSYSWTQTSGKTLLIGPTRGSSVTLDVPEDYVVASENTGNVMLILEASNDVGSTAQQVLITIAKRNNGGITVLGVPSLNERELTAPSIDLSGDPDGIGSNIRYQWQSKQGAQTEWVNVPVAGTNALYIIPANTADVVQYRVVVSYTDGQGYEEQVESEASTYEGNTIPNVEITGVPASAVNEGEQITLTAFPHNSENNILPSYSWTQTSGKTLLIGPTRGSSVTLDVPEDYVVASENTGNVMLILEASNDVGSTAQQVLITIAKRNNGGITVLGVPSLNERELTAPSIDLSGDPDGIGSNIRYQWQSKQGAQTEWVNVPVAGTNALYIIPANTADVVQYRVVVSYTDGQGYEEQVESGTSSYKGNTIPSVEIAGVPVSAVNEGEQITLTASPHNSDNNILPSYSWTQTSGKTLLIGPTRGSSVTLDVPEDYVVASENTGNVMLILEASNDVGSTARQVLITIAKRNNGGIAALGVPTLNERELTAPSIDISGDPDGSGNNIRYQWQSKQSAQTEWVNVPAAGTNALYIIPANTEGIVQYRVVVSYTDGQGYEEQVESGTSSYRGNTSPSIELPGSVRLLAGQTTAVLVVISEVDVSDVVTLTIELTSAAGTIHVEPNRIVLGAGLSETRTTQFQLTAEQVGSAKLLLTAVDDSQTVTDSSDAVELTVEVEAAPFTSCGYVDIDRDNDGLIEICNLEGLNAMRNQLFGISYKENVSAPEITTGCAEGGCKGYELVKDLDFNDEGSYKDIANKAIWTTGEGWQPIGVRGNGFGSIFEGNDNTISNLMIDRSLANNVGLFGVVDGQPKINGIGLLDVDINAQSRVGGLAGYITSGYITNSYVTGNVIGQLTVGGLVGQCSYSRVSNSYAIGRMEAMGTIGGIDAGSSSAVGGLVGYLLGSSVSRSHAIGSVKGVGDYAGGLIGSNTGRNGSIIASYAFVDVEGGNNYTGGLVGSNNGINNKISNSYAIGRVVGENVVGGLAGHNRSRNTITNSYSFSNVKGISQVGGLVGNNVGRIINSYAVGRVAGNVEQRGIGGLVGLGFTGGTNNSYWDKTTSGRATSVGGVGQTTAQLQAPTVSGSTPTEVYHGWSEEIWDFGTAKQYPALKYSDGTLMPDQRIGLLSLSALTTEEVSFIFNTEVFDYRLLIDSEVDAVQLLPTATRADANINIVSDSGFSENVASGNLSPAIPLSTTRTTIITIEVEFVSGANRVYRITISRAEQSSPAQLVGVNAPFEHTIPMSVMMDSDNNMRKYEVVSMPSWLERIELKEGLMFSGTPEKDHMGTPSERTIEIRIDNGDGTTQMLSLVLQIDIPTTGTIKLIALPDGILQLDDKLKDDNGIEKKVYIWEHCPVGASAFSELEGVNGMSYELPSEGPYVEAGTAYRVRTTVIDSLGQRKEYTAQIELPQRAPPKPVIRIRAKIFLEGFLK